MPEITVNVELYCAYCGAGICNNGSERRDGRGLDIEPCDNCLSKEYDKGYAEGYAKCEEDNDLWHRQR